MVKFIVKCMHDEDDRDCKNVKDGCAIHCHNNRDGRCMIHCGFATWKLKTLAQAQLLQSLHVANTGNHKPIIRRMD